MFRAGDKFSTLSVQNLLKLLKNTAFDFFMPASLVEKKSAFRLSLLKT